MFRLTAFRDDDGTKRKNDSERIKYAGSVPTYYAAVFLTFYLPELKIAPICFHYALLFTRVRQKKDPLNSHSLPHSLNYLLTYLITYLLTHSHTHTDRQTDGRTDRQARPVMRLATGRPHNNVVTTRLPDSDN